MNFETDLVNIVTSCFHSENICYDADITDTSDFAALYCEMRIRRIVPKPRRVHFSNELNDSLGELARKSKVDRCGNANEAWQAVFRIRSHFVQGYPVTPYLSRKTRDSTFKDGLLWDYGMHHFHLSTQLVSPGLIKRSAYLLFAIVADEDVFFVDIRKHSDPQNLQWVRQDLLSIVSSDWPEIANRYMLRGVTGSTMSDEEKRILRKKNINSAPQLEGHAVAPIGGGTTIDGSSIRCRAWADKLIHEINYHKSVFNNHHSVLKASLRARGLKTTGEFEFKLALLDNLELTEEQIESLQDDHCISRTLCRMGFAIVEEKSRLPIVVLFD